MYIQELAEEKIELNMLEKKQTLQMVEITPANNGQENLINFDDFAQKKCILPPEISDAHLSSKGSGSEERKSPPAEAQPEEEAEKTQDDEKPKPAPYNYYPPAMPYPPQHWPPYYGHPQYPYPPHPHAYGYPPRGYPPYPYPPYPDPYYSDRQGGWGHPMNPTEKVHPEQAGPQVQTQDGKKTQKSDQETLQGPEDSENQARDTCKLEDSPSNLQQVSPQQGDYPNLNEQPLMHQ